MAGVWTSSLCRASELPFQGLFSILIAAFSTVIDRTEWIPTGPLVFWFLGPLNTSWCPLCFPTHPFWSHVFVFFTSLPLFFPAVLLLARTACGITSWAPSFPSLFSSPRAGLFRRVQSLFITIRLPFYTFSSAIFISLHPWSHDITSTELIRLESKPTLQESPHNSQDGFGSLGGSEVSKCPGYHQSRR